MRSRPSHRGLLLLFLLASACGNDSAAHDAAPRDPAPDASVIRDPCNPVDQQGCQDVEKCTFVIDTSDPYGDRTSCVPDGTVPLGEPCQRVAGQNDDCAAPGWCDPDSFSCRPICAFTAELDTCTAGHCTTPDGTFTDLHRIGICRPA